MVNLPGTDAFLLEFDPNTVAERGDALQVQINGNTVLFPSSEGVELLSNLAADVYQSTSGNVDTLAELENDAFTKNSDTTQSIYGYPIDLSDFGIATERLHHVASIWRIGHDIDPVFIAGLPAHSASA